MSSYDSAEELNLAHESAARHNATLPPQNQSVRSGKTQYNMERRSSSIESLQEYDIDTSSKDLTTSNYVLSTNPTEDDVLVSKLFQLSTQLGMELKALRESKQNNVLLYPWTLQAGKALDIPLYQQEWFKTGVSCVCENQHQRNCKHYSLPDWKGSGFNTRWVNKNFRRNIIRVVRYSAMKFANFARMSKNEVKVSMNELRRNPYVTYALHLSDEKFIDPSKHNDIRDLYALRRRFGVNNDYGFKSILCLEAQGLPSEDEIRNTTSSFLRHDCGKGLYEYLKSTMSSVWNYLTSAFNMISSIISSLVDKIKSVIFELISRLFKPFDMLTKITDSAFLIKCGLAISGLCFVVGCLGGMIGTRLAQKFFQVNYNIDDFEAQGVTKTITSVVSTINPGSMENVRKRCLQILSIWAVGGVIKISLQQLLILLPDSIHYAILERFGSIESRDKKRAELWVHQARILEQYSKIPKVITSDEYRKDLKRCMGESMNLLTTIKTPGVRALILNLNITLQKIQSILAQFDSSRSVRNEPFSIHLCGPPGIGKTNLIKNLVPRAFDFTSRDTYMRPVKTGYWDGYRSQEVVVLDEFLLGDQVVRSERALEYLSLVSCGQFQPELASLDNVTTGIKGTTCEPKVVISINNTLYDSVPGISDEALQRRRKYVIYCLSSVEPPVDLSQMSLEQLQKCSWLGFILFNRSFDPSQDVSSMPLLNFEMLITKLREDYSQHNDVCEAIYNSSEASMDYIDPITVYKQAMQDSLSIPRDKTPIGSILGMFSAQGRSRRKRKLDDFGTQDSATNTDESSNEETTDTEQNTDNTNTEIPPEVIIDKDKAYGMTEHFSCCLQGKRHRHKCSICTEHWVCDSGDDDNWINLCRRHLKMYNEDLDSFLMDVVKLSSHGIKSPRNIIILENITTSEKARKALEFQSLWFMVRHPYFVLSNCSLFVQVVPIVAKSLVSGFAIAFGLMYAMLALRGWLKGSEERNQMVAQSSFSFETRATRQPRTNREFKLRTGMQAQGTSCNYMKLNGTRYDFVPLYGKKALTFAHSFEMGGILDGEKFEVCIDGKKFEESFNSSLLVRDEEHDYAIYTFMNKMIQNFKDIRKRFISENDLIDFGNPSVCIHGSENIYGNSKTVNNASYVMMKKRKELDIGIIYNVPTKVGDCGALIEIVSGPHATKYCGIHVAGNSSVENPFGLATPITQELLTFVEDYIIGDPNFQDFIANGMESIRGPNLICSKKIDNREIIHLPRLSKLKPSLLMKYLPWLPLKQPPLLSQSDKRNISGKDPIMMMIQDTADTVHKDVDNEVVKGVYETMAINYDRDLKFPISYRTLTFEEAIRGVPGKLASLNLTTSPGYPLVFCRVKRGKTDFIEYLPNGGLWYDERLLMMVTRILNDMEAGVEPNHVWTAYLKDELMSPTKISDGRTRIIYASALASTIAFRMKFGFILAAMHASYRSTPLSIGINQYSHDMQLIYDYLANNSKFMVAGDYKAFDKRCHPVFRDQAYNLIMNIARRAGVSENAITYFMKHETKSPAQVLDHRFWFVSNHMSGCFFTTIINCLVNEGYMRWCFRQVYPMLIYDDYVKGKFLGDDHVLSVKADICFTPVVIAEQMERIGQTYTMADKESMLSHRYSEFKDVTFLGAHPVMVNGLWSGALKKETLREAVLWTRDKNISLKQVCRQMIEYCSQWERTFYDDYVMNIQKALQKTVGEILMIPGYEELRAIVANRTSEVGANFTRNWYAQGKEKIEVVSKSLTTLHAKRQIVDKSNIIRFPRGTAAKAIAEKEIDIQYGLNSTILRHSLQWHSNQPAGTILQSWSVPGEILALANQANIQNMAFQRLIYFHGDLDLTFQINAQPFLAGLLCIFFYPYGAFASQRPDRVNWTACEHIKLQPNLNTTRTLRIPYMYVRSVLNTFAMGLSPSTESFGMVHIGVLSALSGLAASQVTITMFSEFRNSDLAIPRPPPSVQLALEAQGSSNSKVENNYNFSGSSIAGNVPIENGKNNANATQETKVDTDLSIPIPMDNLPISSCSVPVMQLISGMSKSNGLEPTTSFDFHPETLTREHFQIGNSKQLELNYIYGRESLLTEFDWKTGDAEAAQLYKTTVNSVMGLPFSRSQNVPANLALLNQFGLWRGRILLKFRFIRTRFQSGRLRWTMAYGAPDLDATQQTVYYNHVLDANDEAYEQEVLIEPNFGTEFLLTYDGPNTIDQIQSYSYGTMGVYVANRLVAPDSVPQSIKVQVYISLLDVESVFIKPFPITQYRADAGIDFKAQGLEPEEQRLDTEEEEIHPTTESPDVNLTSMCKLKIGSKFEYPTMNVVDIVRRYTRLNLQFDQMQTVVSSNGFTGVSMPIELCSFIMNYYAAWAGTLKVRYYGGDESEFVTLMPRSNNTYESNQLFIGPEFDPSTKWTRVPGAASVGPAPSTASARIPSVATERIQIVETKNSQADFMVPFYTHFNNLPTGTISNSLNQDRSIGNATNIIANLNIYQRNSTFKSPVVYVSGADDFRPLFYRPPTQVYFYVLNVASNPLPDGVSIGNIRGPLPV